MLTYTPDNNVFFTVDFDRFDCHNLATGTGRWSYKCTIVADGQTIDAGTVNSSSGDTQDNPTRLGEMLASFLVFFSDYVEAANKASRSTDDGHDERLGMFPEGCRTLAELLDGGQVHQWADEIVAKF